MPILDFEKPKKLRSTANHNDEYQSDSGIAGTYVPNMSEEDKLKWKARKIGGTVPRVEVRKTLRGVQLLAVVYRDEVKLSANGRMAFSLGEWQQLIAAVGEAREELKNANVL